MIVNLAGFNVDVENIKILKNILESSSNISSEEIETLKKLEWTPETISASYGRISRSPEPINELREKARVEVEKSRKSNSTIIFDMGHSSIAEHAVFNIDIINITRLLAEELEKARLISFTEKSQRYIKIGEDIYYPEEFKTDKTFSEKYVNLTKELFSAYNQIHDALIPYFKEKYPVENTKSSLYRDVINMAKEDARYILPLGMLTQVGVTSNARSLEKVIRRLNSSDLPEARELGKKIYDIVVKHAPSLVKYTTPTEYETETYKLVKNSIGEIKNQINTDEVTLIDFDKDFEDKILASLIMKTSQLDYNSSLATVKKWDKSQKEKILLASIKYLNSYDNVLREFETSNFEFNILITATGFAQLKRHRMTTIIDGEYSTSSGAKTPKSITDIGMKDFFQEKISKIDILYSEAKEKFGKTADYILSNAHRKNVYLKCNLRELVHITRLRSDAHAQWDIREISDLMTAEVQKHSSIIGSLLCGKDMFNDNMLFLKK